MDAIWFIIFLINYINATNLRCYEGSNGSHRLMEHCRACVIFIDMKMNTTIAQRKIFLKNQSSIPELVLYGENQRHRRQTNTMIHQKCAAEFTGPLYGYDQTHCYCNSHLCNSNIQGCIYEIVSKRYFSCYHGSNSSQNALEIYKKCRSCRIKKEVPWKYHYECLTFGEQEEKSDTHCTCQHPMCNQDFSICQRFQQIPSQLRVNTIQEPFLNSTQSSMTILTSLMTSSTKTSTRFAITNHTEIEISTENSTSIDLTSVSYNETQQMKTVMTEMKNHANSFFFHSFFSFYMIVSFVI